jgi:hypothetical protein
MAESTFADFRALIGDDGMADLEALVQRVIRRTNFRRIAQWRIGDPLEHLIGPIVLSTLVEAIKPMNLAELRAHLKDPIMSAAIEPSPANPVARPSAYTVTCLPADEPDASSWDITVEERENGLWAAKWRGATLGRDGTWDWNGITVRELRDAWIAEHWFPLDEALRLAKKAAPHIVSAGMTPADVCAWRTQQATKKN